MTDIINRAEAIKAINKRMDKVPVDRPDVAFGLCVAAGVLHDMPPVNDRPTGHWIFQTEDKYQCSCCGEVIRVKEVMNEPQYITCPMCDARMVGDENGRQSDKP